MAVDMKNLTRFPRTYNLTDFGVTANVVCQPSQYNKLGTVTVTAQTLAAWGATDVVNGGATGRAIYMRLDDTTGTQLHGKVRFAVANATETEQKVILEERTQRLSASSTGDRTIAVLLQESRPLAKEDSKLVMYFYPDSATAVTVDYDGTNTSANLPVTIYQ